MLARFEKQLTREAKSKLTLAAFVPLPDNVDNQRYEPIFDRHPITGKTYTTASGTVVLNEVQYYNGQMVQLYGECTNVAAVSEELAGKRLQADDHDAAGWRRNRDRAILVASTHRHFASPIQCHVHHRCRGLRRYSGIRGVHQSRRKWGIERAVDARRLL